MNITFSQFKAALILYHLDGQLCGSGPESVSLHKLTMSWLNCRFQSQDAEQMIQTSLKPEAKKRHN